MPEPRGLNIYFRQASISAMSLTNVVEAEETTRVEEKRYIKKSRLYRSSPKSKRSRISRCRVQNRLEMFLEAVKVRDWREASA